MELSDIISQEEIESYYNEWTSFNQKYKPETNYNVHSGISFIGKVFQFKDKPIFRAHIFKRKLKKAFDPYFISNRGYLYPCFHTVHYFFPIEQIYHASMLKLVPDYFKFITIDRFHNKKAPKMYKRVDFEKTKLSVELLANIKLRENKFVGRASITFYDDITNETLHIWYFECVGGLRNYIKCIEKLKQGDNTVIENLIRQIKGRSTKYKSLINKRHLPLEEYLINELKKGNIPEKELHDFFSYYDKE